MVTKFVDVPGMQLQVGDRVRRYDADETDRGRAVVYRIKEGRAYIEVELEITCKSGNRHHKLTGAPKGANWKALRRVPCGLPVCEAHLVARAPGKYLCWSHIDAWKAVA